MATTLDHDHDRDGRATAHDHPGRSEPGDETAPSGAAGGFSPPMIRGVWFGTVTLVALALAFAPLPAYDYDRSGLNLHPVTPLRLWWAQAVGVRDGRWDGLATAGFLALLAAFLVLTALALWVSLWPGDPASVAPDPGDANLGEPAAPDESA